MQLASNILKRDSNESVRIGIYIAFRQRLTYEISSDYNRHLLIRSIPFRSVRDINVFIDL